MRTRPLASPTTSLRLGIDVGGTAIKYGVVDTADGTVLGPVRQVPTPQPATPVAVADALSDVVAQVLLERPELDPADSGLPVGVAFPSVIRNGVALSAANISADWMGLDVNAFLSDRLGCPVRVSNDADAAGLAEAAHGAGHGTGGVIMVLTLGTGIGSALVADGKLVPNFELGHLELGGTKAERKASAVARERDGLDWAAYAERLQEYLAHVEFLFSPDLMILGGGISVRHGEFLPHLSLRTPVVPALLANTAGVVGAALTVS
ncbi:polyphosphate glucokinase [Arthrobacter sp. ERGS1:01]|uniref:polyphosphate--glucose phosphotransferase n=1 Tax=Arthrobacter sp. ERGS1:01 TaxID=1704044 RepID=UPI0006B416E6|nr:ROK family protein [Arthrobacter sp. ERGS1:01]ALE07619.1 polyphosphate glucokinase [Arthrobacter sp. ERGS1:01]